MMLKQKVYYGIKNETLHLVFVQFIQQSITTSIHLHCPADSTISRSIRPVVCWQWPNATSKNDISVDNHPEIESVTLGPSSPPSTWRQTNIFIVQQAFDSSTISSLTIRIFQAPQSVTTMNLIVNDSNKHMKNDVTRHKRKNPYERFGCRSTCRWMACAEDIWS